MDASLDNINVEMEIVLIKIKFVMENMIVLIGLTKGIAVSFDIYL